MTLAAEAQAPARRIVTKKQLAEEVLKWSRSRLDRRLDSDPEFPVETRGTQAGGWAFDADAVLAYLGAAVDEPEEETPAPVAHQAEETSRSRLNLAQALIQEDRLRMRRGELIEAEPLKLALSETVTKVSTGLNVLPDTLVRRLNLPESAGAVIRQEVDQLRRTLVTALKDALAGG